MRKSQLGNAIRCGALIAALSALAPPPPAAAQNYPDRAVRIIVPTAAGGSIDTTARVVAGKLAEFWGKPVVIENRPGAAMIIGAEAAAKSAPDGYTLLVAHDGTMAMNPVVYPNLAYHSQRDFEPVALLTAIPEVVLVHEGVPVKTVGELIAHAKANPGKLNHASGGTATLLALELFKAMAGVDIASIPFRGAAPAITGTMAGETQVIFADLASANAGMQSGKLRTLAVTTLTRVSRLPQVPTIDESGVPGYDVATWIGALRADRHAEVGGRQDRGRHQARARHARRQGQARGAEHGDPLGGRRGDARGAGRRHGEVGQPGEGQEYQDRAVGWVSPVGWVEFFAAPNIPPCGRSCWGSQALDSTYSSASE
jgi:tripartite-type tricarboxylate transporter receptor subunit TctC